MTSVAVSTTCEPDSFSMVTSPTLSSMRNVNFLVLKNLISGLLSALGMSFLFQKQPTQIGNDGLPASNSIHTPVPTSGIAKNPRSLPAYGTHGIAHTGCPSST